MNEMPPRPPEPTFGSGLYEGTAADYDRFRLPYADGLVDRVSQPVMIAVAALCQGSPAWWRDMVLALEPSR